ncbi:MAG: hypothetical protein AAGF24_16390 [Cyanobacteria bacterium P01_H01_bin.121]
MATNNPGTASNICWQYGSNAAGNADALATIQAWWAGLVGEEVFLQQRIRGNTPDSAQIDWSPQRFDERFYLKTAELRGITLYWQKTTASDEQNSTAQRLELDSNGQYLDVYPQSQPDLIMRITGPRQPVYQTVQLTNPEIERRVEAGKFILTLKDPMTETAVEVTMSAETLLALKRQLP